MRFLRKVNLGAVVSVVLLIGIAVYIVTMTIVHQDLDKESQKFLSSFFAEDADWRTIPEEYRTDSEGYIKSIEKEVKKYFYDDDVYQYYIDIAILSQFDQNLFFENSQSGSCIVDFGSSKFDGKLYEISAYVSNSIYSEPVDVVIVEGDEGIRIDAITLTNSSTPEFFEEVF